MQVQSSDSDSVTITLSRSELVTLREAISYIDFNGDLPSRSVGEVQALGDFLRLADPLIPELGSDRYNEAVDAAWRIVAES
jgi:hypothetical protein